MKVKIIENNDRKIVFLLEETTPQFANALRRLSMVEVPNMAIQTVDFSKNDSVLYDEIIAHRLGMAPIVFDPKNFNMKDACKCEGKGCSLCEVVFAINKKGPGVVYTKDMKSSNSEVKMLYDTIPLVELGEGHTLKLTATASLGIGRSHAKFNTATSFFRYYPMIEMKEVPKNAEDCVKICPKNALDIRGNKASVTMACDLCQECVRTAEPKGSLKVWGDDTKFIFTVESISGLTAEQIILSAVDVLKKKAKELERDIKKLK